MLLHVKFGKIDNKNVVIQANLAVFSMPNGYTTLFNIFNNIDFGKTTFSCFCLLLFNEIFYKAIYN